MRLSRKAWAFDASTPLSGLDLIAAFKQDAVKLRYRDWDDLMGYCILSAAPVGRYLVDLHGEGRRCYPASDALCNALQVLNHLQDCQADYRDLDRVYLPEPWLAEAGGSVAELGRPRATPAVRRVIDRLLDRTAELVRDARPLAGQRIGSRHRQLDHHAPRLLREPRVERRRFVRIPHQREGPGAGHLGDRYPHVRRAGGAAQW